jgi:hypothetical protein
MDEAGDQAERKPATRCDARQRTTAAVPPADRNQQRYERDERNSGMSVLRKRQREERTGKCG